MGFGRFGTEKPEVENYEISLRGNKFKKTFCLRQNGLDVALADRAD
ncbi:hypothetical protein SPSYN_02944 [Sporotomaculum syntrophicum]|uniref:Uncharacterized protein n=1 Tax=Sporotomaculum syntrophicum TaxID=182264 RepID=A0A9D2WM70_9FIRM|nr:hypothetical protein SPSYN_02944 [Sporotomaculum syntrophicum]